jgi:YD repeat-containing protein
MTGQDQHNLSGGTDTYGGSSGGPHALTTAATTGGSTSTSTFGYDAAGNMTSRSTPASGSQTLTWDSAGQFASVAGSKGTASYVYDTDGNLLQEDPGSTTLYLPGEQLSEKRDRQDHLNQGVHAFRGTTAVRDDGGGSV